jgi:hypothetical protein
LGKTSQAVIEKEVLILTGLETGVRRKRLIVRKEVKIVFQSMNCYRCPIVLLFSLIFFAPSGVIANCNKLFPIPEGDYSYGYIDSTGKVIVKPQFEFANKFQDGVGIVRIDDDTYGLIERAGSVRRFAQASPFSDYFEGVAVALIGEKTGLVDKKGMPITIFDFDVESSENRPASTRFSDGIAALPILNGGIVFIDKHGRIVIRLDSAESTTGFNEGIAVVVFRNGSNALINKKGEIILGPFAPEVGNSISRPSEGLVRIGKHLSAAGERRNWKYVNNTGSIVLEVDFDFAGDFHSGLAPIVVKDKWGFMDLNGKAVIRPQFDHAQHFKQGVAAVRLAGKWGFIDKSGRFVVPPRFGLVKEAFDCDLAYVQEGQYEGYINLKGAWVWKHPQATHPVNLR